LDVSIPRDAVAANVQNGWITLTGELNWPAAERDIRPLYGVIGVSNQTVIVPIVTAQNIADDIMHALHRSWFLNPEAITASAEGGTVQLTGAVRSALDRQFAGNSPRQPHGWRPARPPSTTTSSFDESAAARAPTAAAH
jgi:osmotically-inducible protein OsmY